jgi:hypothetical protein
MSEKVQQPMTNRLWRFLHMLSHIPLGFGEPRWATRFHDWTASEWDKVCKE